MRLEKRRKSLELTPKDAAHRIGISPQYLGQLENGVNSPPTWERLKEIAKVYETSTDYLLGLTDDPSPKPKAIPQAKLSLNESTVAYEIDRVQEMIWLMRDLPEEKQRAILDIAKVVKSLNS